MLHNSVFSDVKNLFDTYGTREITGTCYRFSVAGAVTGSSNYANNDDNQNCGEKRVMWYLWFPDQQNLTTVQMPLPKEEQVYLTTTHWPDGWNFFYSPIGKDCGPPWITCTTIWRSGQKSDLAQYWANLREERKRQANEANIPLSEMENAQQEDDNKIKRYFALIMHLNADHWVNDDVVLAGIERAKRLVRELRAAQRGCRLQDDVAKLKDFVIRHLFLPA